MQSLIADTLKAWREAERVLNSLSPVDPNHETTRGLVIELRSMYAKVSEATDLSADAVAEWRAQLEKLAAALTEMRRETA